MKLTQEEINQRVVEAQQKKDRCETLTTQEWRLLQYAFPASCPSCGTSFAIEVEGRNE